MALLFGDLWRSYSVIRNLRVWLFVPASKLGVFAAFVLIRAIDFPLRAVELNLRILLLTSEVELITVNERVVENNPRLSENKRGLFRGRRALLRRAWARGWQAKACRPSAGVRTMRTSLFQNNKK